MISTNLKILLAERNLTISKVCEDTGISRTTLTALCSNKSKGIQFDTLDTLCNYLNVFPENILTFSPYKLTFEKSKFYSDYICIIIENCTTRKKNQILSCLDKPNYLTLEDKDLEFLKKVINSLPKFYITTLDNELKNILINEFYIEPEKLDFFSITTNLY